MNNDPPPGETIEVSGARIIPDPDRTRAAYETAFRDWDACTCDYCVNFEAAFPRVLPFALRTYLDSLGIDYRKPVEAIHYGRTPTGLHYYEAEWRFFGTVDGDRDLPRSARVSEHVQIAILDSSLPAPKALCEQGTLALCVTASAVPWVIDRPEPE